MPLPPNYPAFPLPSTAIWLQSSTPSSPQHHLLPTLSQQPTYPLRSNRTHHILRVWPPFSKRWWFEQELIEENRKRDAQHLADATKPRTESYTPARRLTSHPLCITSNRYFRGIPLLSPPKIFRSLTPRCWQYYSFARPTLSPPFWLMFCGRASCRRSYFPQSKSHRGHP